MTNVTPSSPPTEEIKQAYSAYTLADSIRNSKVACILVILLMPFGYILDYFVYHGQLEYFFKLRLYASVLGLLNLAALYRPNLSPSVYRVLCMGWYIIPSFLISRIINVTEGASSTYYAGLNL